MTTPKTTEAGGGGSGRERLRREDCLRTGPIRNWSTLYRRSNSWNLRDPSVPPSTAGEASDGSCGDVVSHAVELGYRVVEDQIRQGQRIAEQLSTRSYDSHAMKGDLRDVAERAWRYYTDLGALWVDFLASLAGNGELMRGLVAAWKAGPGETSPPASSDGTNAIPVEVASARFAQVIPELRPHCETMPLRCQALHAGESGKPPLTDVHFETAANGRLHLRVRIGDAQPPGTYTGTVINSQTGDLCGTVTVKLT